MNYRTGWGGVKQVLPRLSCLMTQVQSAPWNFSQKSLPPHPSLPGQVFRCSLQQWKRPLSSQCPQRTLWLCRNTQLHIQEYPSLLFQKYSSLCPLFAGGTMKKVYGSRDYLLPFKEQRARKEKNKWRWCEMIQDWSETEEKASAIDMKHSEQWGRNTGKKWGAA